MKKIFLLLIVITVFASKMFAQWELIKNLPHEEKFFIIDNKLCLYGGNGLFISYDGGFSFDTLFHSNVRFIGYNKNTIFLQTDDCALKSNDLGQTWDTLKYENQPFNGGYCIAFHNFEVLIGVYNEKYLYSNDFGENFELREVDNSSDLIIHALVYYNSSFYAYSKSIIGDYIWRSDDNLQTWQLIYQQKAIGGDKNNFEYDFLISPWHDLVITKSVDFGGGLVLISEDGNSFYELDSNFIYEKLVFSDNAAIAYCAKLYLNQLRVFKNGFENYDIFPLDFQIYDMTIFNNYLYIIKYQSNEIYRAPLSQFMSNNELKDENNVSIYPNPVADLLNVSINNPTNSEIELKLYDILGQLIKTKTTRGKKKIQMDVSDLSAGIYTVEVLGNNLYKSQKIVIQ